MFFGRPPLASSAVDYSATVPPPKVVPPGLAESGQNAGERARQRGRNARKLLKIRAAWQAGSRIRGEREAGTPRHVRVRPLESAGDRP